MSMSATARRTCSAPSTSVTGEVVGRCFQRRRAVEFIKFMNEVVKPHGDREIHVVLDNLSTHNGTDVDEWLVKHPNVTFHFTPIGSSWLNQIEIWFGVITRQAIRRGTFGSVRQLVDTIKKYITHWNQDTKPLPGPPNPATSSPRSSCSTPTSRRC